MNPLDAFGRDNDDMKAALRVYGKQAGQIAPSATLGLDRQNETYGGMQALGAQLAQRAAGMGPNPALAQLAMTTGQNVAAQNALMAGVRGASANPGAVARQAAQQGAAIQQNAVGQAATLSAQQQIAAQQALQQQQAQQAALATTQVGQGLNAAQQQAGAAVTENQLMQQQLSEWNRLNLANTQQENAANAAVQGAAVGQSTKFLGDAVKGIGGAVAGLTGFAEGGEVPAPAGAPAPSGPRSRAGQMMAGMPAAPVALAQGGTVQPPVPAWYPYQPKKLDPSSPAAQKELELARQESKEIDAKWKRGTPDRDVAGGYAKGGSVDMRAKGGKVPGTAKVKGDSYANDTVDAKLSPKEIVLPRSVTMSSDPVGNSARFVAAVMAKRNRR